MSLFLENVAQYIYKKYKDELGDSALIFPGRRATVFFKKYLSTITTENIWAPSYLTVSDFFRKQSDILVIDELKLLFQLFVIFKEETKSNETFDQFYYWGGMLLNDFDDVDKHLVNADQLFNNIESLKEIDEKFSGLSEQELEIIKQFWTNVDPSTETLHKKEFIKVWKVLGNIYNRYKNSLLKNNQGYEGMVFRDVAEKIKESGNDNFPWKKVFFIGLNAISPAEFTVMRSLYNTGKAEFFWDYDNFYVKDKINEAGMFIRENLKNFPSPDYNNNFNNIIEIRKEIEVIAVSSNIGQAKVLNNALQDVRVNSEKIETCIVLGDENLLLPVLHSVPEDIDKINVTMGYPLNGSTVYHFIKTIIDLHQSVKISNKKDVFYFKPVIALLYHPYFTFWEDQAKSVINYIIDKNKVYLSSDSLKINEFFSLVFREKHNPEEFAEQILDILYFLIEKMSNSLNEDEKNEKDTNILNDEKYLQKSIFDDKKENSSGDKYFEIEKEFIYQSYLLIKRFIEIYNDLKLKVQMPTFIRMLKKALQAGKVNFIGEPLAGLQVMGALETRGLDFKNLVILSMNEGQFPRKGTAMSFIPYSLRKAFKLPTYEFQDAIYAYYFYRLLQRAEKICLIYNSNSEGILGGEMSRFIYQLKYTSDLKLNFKNVEYHIQGSNPKSFSIKKSKVIQKKLKKYIQNEGDAQLSPSAINYFKNCSLKFYFRYIVGLKEYDEVSEEIDSALFGNILHYALKEIYIAYQGKTVSEDILNKILKDDSLIQSVIDHAFAVEYFKSDITKKVTYSGRNIIVKEVIMKYLKELLNKDKLNVPFKIIKLEEKYSTVVPVFDGKAYINIAGKIDRIDFKNGVYRILDYKSGSVQNSFKTIERLFFPDKSGEGDAIAQVFLYAYIFKKSQEITEKAIIPSLLYLKEIYNKDFNTYISKQVDGRKRQMVDTFEPYYVETEQFLILLLEQLFSEDTCFTQTDNLDYCRHCSYRQICQR